MYAAQSVAIKKGSTVDYSGIRKIELEITSEFKSIPLTGQDDFQGIEFVVENNVKDVFLFTLIRKEKPNEVEKRLLDGSCFKSIPILKNGEFLLVIEDKNLWVDNRVGYSYGHTRKDVLLIKNGKSINNVIAPYNNRQSSPSCTFVEVPSESCDIGGFTLTRTADSKYKTFCLKVKGIAHILLRDIVINTPDNELACDKAINIVDCADVTLKDITINGTYSQPNRYGYGININNAWNTHMVNVSGTATWGVLGNNNLSDTYLTNCQLNRFDIHCYGRNVFMEDCIFDGSSHGWNCGGSSIYGIVRYDRCTFVRCTPFGMGDSYKTAVGVDVVFNDCVFNVTKKKNAIFKTRVLNSNMNLRHGLTKKNLPNIEINNMTVNVPKGVNTVLLYDVGDVTYSGSVGYISNVKINGLNIICVDCDSRIDFKFIDTSVKTDKLIKVSVSRLSAPKANIVPIISSNHRNRVKITKSSFSSVESLNGVRLKTKNVL